MHNHVILKQRSLQNCYVQKKRKPTCSTKVKLIGDQGYHAELTKINALLKKDFQNPLE